MKITATVLSSLFLPHLAAAQIGSAELVLTYPSMFPGSSVEHYGTTGTTEGSFTGLESSWISSALLADGRLVVHNNSGLAGIRVLSPTGLELQNWPVTVANYSSDIDLFADGTIAICARGEGLLYYDLAGNTQGSINPTGMVSAMGLQIQPDETIWVADMGDPFQSIPGKVWHLNRQGNVLHSFASPIEPSDVARAGDGTVWVSGYGGEIAHYATDGTLLAQFPAVINSGLKTLWSLAIGYDGLVWASGHYDSMVHAYDQNGNVVFSFDTTAPGNSTFSFFTPGISSNSTFCTGDLSAGACPCGNSSSNGGGCQNSTGVGAILTGSGIPSVGADSLVFHGNHLIPGQAALLFAGATKVNGGTGQFFGNGLLCAGGAIQRVSVVVPGASGDATWGPGIIGAQGWSIGTTRYMQAWYRDTTGNPCGSLFNLSNGMELVVGP